MYMYTYRYYERPENKAHRMMQPKYVMSQGTTVEGEAGSVKRQPKKKEKKKKNRRFQRKHTMAVFGSSHFVPAHTTDCSWLDAVRNYSAVRSTL